MRIKNNYKLILIIAIFFTLIIPNFSNASSVSVGKVKSLKTSSITTNTLSLKWKKVSKATGYKIYLYNTSTKKYEYKATTTKTSYTLKKLKSAKEYKIKVRAYKTIRGKKYYGKYSTILRTVTLPEKTQDVVSKSRTDNSVTISWKKVTRATAYKVYIYDSSSKSYKYYGNSSGNSITIKNLSSAKTYKVRVRAYKKEDGIKYYGAYSSSVNIVTNPSQVKNLKLSSRSESTIKVSWDSVKRAKGYRVYIYNYESSKWEYYKQLTENFITISGLKSGTPFQVRVRAYYEVDKTKYYGSYSEKIKTATNPKQVINLASSKQTTSSITVNWSKVESTTGYAVYLYNDGSNSYKLYGTTKSNSIEIKNLDTARFYKVYVKAYLEVDGTKYYGKGSNVLSQNTLSTNNIRLGLDVSKWQEDINWKAVKNAGIKFAMIRIGYRGDDVGKIYEDKYFATNIKQALDVGIEVGVYFYAYSITEDEAIEEAQWIINKLKEYELEDKCKYIAYDFECYNKNRAKSISKSQVNKDAIAFLNCVQENGYTPILYGNKNYLTTIFDTANIVSEVKDCKIWLAQYNTEATYDGDYDMWQYTSTGIIDGISGNVDLDIIYF